MKIQLVKVPIQLSKSLYYLKLAKQIFLAKHEGNKAEQIFIYKKVCESGDLDLIKDLQKYFNIPFSELCVIIPTDDFLDPDQIKKIQDKARGMVAKSYSDIPKLIPKNIQ